MLKNRKLVFLAALSTALLGAALIFAGSDESPAELPSVDQVLETYVKAVGGRKALETLTTRDCSGLLTHDLHARETPTFEEIPFAAMAKTPDKCVVMYNRTKGVAASGFDGAGGWRRDDNGVHADEFIGRDKLSWLLNPQGALRVQDYFPDLVVVALEQLGDTSVVVLESKKLDNTYNALYFDTETGLLVRIGNYWQLSDYREIDGVLVPHRVEMSRKGGVSRYEFQRISHNAPFSDSVFAAPVSVDIADN